MRILHLDSGREMGGGQWQSLRLHEGLLARGYDSVLLRRGEMSPLRIRDKWDIIHAHDARSHTLAALVARAPVVVSRRVAFPIGSRWKYGRARLYIAVSNFVAGMLREYPVVTVYDGVPLPDKLARGDRWIGIEHKGADIAGVEPSDNLERDLPHARGLIYLSKCEGLGSAILLAMAHGVPVVASNVGGVPEIVRHGENGFLINTYEEVHEAMKWVHHGMREAARATVEQKFTIDHMVEGTLAAYRKARA